MGRKADAPFTIPMPGTSSRKRDVRPYTRGFEDESKPREADRDIAVSATERSPSVLANSMPSPRQPRRDRAMAGKSLTTLINWGSATGIAEAGRDCRRDARITRRTAAPPAMKS